MSDLKRALTEHVQQRTPAAVPPFTEIRDRHRRASRRRAASTAAAAAAAVAALVTGVPYLSGGGGDPAPAAGLAVCPGTVSGGDIATSPTPGTGDDLGGADRLVPQDPPQAATVCAYDMTADPSAAVRLADSVDLPTADLRAMTTDLTHLPRRLPGQSHLCTTMGGGPPRAFLLALRYRDGTVRVSTRTDPNRCVDTTNGTFDSPTYIADQVQLALQTGRWPEPPERRSPVPDPCHHGRPGRLGQEVTLVPAAPASAVICTERPRAGRDPEYRTTSLTGDDAADLARAFDELPTTPTQQRCSPTGTRGGAYSIQFRYAAGPPVAVSIHPDCEPAISNGSLDSRDAASVLDLVREAALPAETPAATSPERPFAG